MSIAERDDPSIASRLRFNEVQYAMWLCRAMCTTATLKIADAIGGRADLGQVLAARLGLHSPSLLRLLRALAANGIFEDAGASTFRHNDMSRQLRTDHAFSLQPIAALMDAPLIKDSWDGLAGALRDGESGFSHRRGVSLYEHLRGSPADGALFMGAMASHSVQPSAAIAALPLFREADRWSTWAAAWARSSRASPGPTPAYAASSSISRTSRRGPARLPRAAGVADRVTFQAGDFFERAPRPRRLHSQERPVELGRRALSAALAEQYSAPASSSRDARLLVIEPVLLSSNLAWSSLFDLQMLAATDSGRSRTGRGDPRSRPPVRLHPRLPHDGAGHRGGGVLPDLTEPSLAHLSGYANVHLIGNFDDAHGLKNM